MKNVIIRISKLLEGPKVYVDSFGLVDSVQAVRGSRIAVRWFENLLSRENKINLVRQYKHVAVSSLSLLTDITDSVFTCYWLFHSNPVYDKNLYTFYVDCFFVLENEDVINFFRAIKFISERKEHENKVH